MNPTAARCAGFGSLDLPGKFLESLTILSVALGFVMTFVTNKMKDMDG